MTDLVSEKVFQTRVLCSSQLGKKLLMAHCRNTKPAELSHVRNIIIFVQGFVQGCGDVHERHSFIGSEFLRDEYRF
jgi:hypothetical protein